jgi:DNA-directed RNA polymerase specialized sigma24 family protein
MVDYKTWISERISGLDEGYELTYEELMFLAGVVGVRVERIADELEISVRTCHRRLSNGESIGRHFRSALIKELRDALDIKKIQGEL